MGASRYASALVLGLGKSGEAAAHLLVQEGTRVLVVDRSGGSEREQRARRLRDQGVAVVLEAEDVGAAIEDAGGSADAIAYAICVVSPGIPVDDPWLQPVRARGIDILSELELGASRCESPILAVTGSNGKSTFTKLCGQVLKADGYRYALAGNYGLPLCDVAVAAKPLDWIVTEVSSFQLETVRDFAPAMAVLLNIQPDHLDRHGDMTRYARLKARLFDRLQSTNTAVVHEEALAWVREGTRGCPQWVTFGCGPQADYRYAEGRVVYRDLGRKEEVSLIGTPFNNAIMGCTAAAVLAALRSAGIAAPSIEQGAMNFEPLAHRMQTLPAVDGIRFIDDSKATNLSALIAALRMVDQPVRLIAGGKAKEKEWGGAKEMLAKTVRSVYLLGGSAWTLKRAWQKEVPCHVCGTLEQATWTAWRDANPGEIILLSPGCASFDQFENYEERGICFQKIVESIRKRKGTHDED